MNRLVLRVLHFVCALTLPLALLILVSCIQAHEEHAPLGPEFDPNQLDEVLTKATDGATVSRLQKDQMIHYEESVRVDNRDPSLHMSTHVLNVIDRSPNPGTDSVRITYHHSNSFRDEDGTWQDIETEDTYDIPNSPSLSAGLLLSLGQNDVVSLSKAMAMAPLSSPTHISYHNLKVFEGDIDPPSVIKKKANCGGVPNCRLHATFLSFDEARWSDDSHYTKVTWKYTLTNQLPYMEGLFGAMIERCAGFSAVQDSKTHYLNDCQYLTDAQL